MTSELLFRPAPTDADQGTSYTRVVRLGVPGAGGGHLLATFEYFEARAFPIYESRDDGVTWSTSPISLVRDTVHGEGWSLRWQPDLYVVPTPSGDLAPGTVLLAGTALPEDVLPGNILPADGSAQDIHLYVSVDDGRSWSFRSSIARSPHGGGGVWEPHLRVLGDGRLVAYYSDETHKAQGYNQLLGHKVSTDGGRTWGSERIDVAAPGGRLRPGMAAVAELPGGGFVMTFELVTEGEYDGPNPVYVKRSPDGLDWGDAEDLGEPIRSARGAFPGATPYVVWSPAGGPLGTIVVSARDLFSSDGGGRVLFMNRDLGRGPWEELLMPVQYAGGNDHAGWSQGMLVSEDGQRVLHLASSQFASGKNEIRYGTAALP